MPRDIIDDPLPHRYRNAAEGRRREAGGRPAGRVAEGDGSGTGGRRGEAEQEGQGRDRRREASTGSWGATGRRVLPTERMTGGGTPW